MENINSTYTVLIIVLITWLGIAFYLFRLDGKVNKLEKRNKQNSITNNE